MDDILIITANTFVHCYPKLLLWLFIWILIWYNKWFELNWIELNWTKSGHRTWIDQAMHQNSNLFFFLFRIHPNLPSRSVIMCVWISTGTPTRTCTKHWMPSRIGQPTTSQPTANTSTRQRCSPSNSYTHLIFSHISSTVSIWSWWIQKLPFWGCHIYTRWVTSQSLGVRWVLKKRLWIVNRRFLA